MSIGALGAKLGRKLQHDLCQAPGKALDCFLLTKFVQVQP